MAYRKTNPKSPDPHTTVRIPMPMLDRFREIAEAEHRTVSQEIRRLVEAHIASYDEQKEAA